MRQDLKFLREYFSIPKSAKVNWGLIEEIVSGEKPELRPGLIVAKRRNRKKKIYQKRRQIKTFPDKENQENLSLLIFP